MRGMKTEQVMRWALRARICPGCRFRPPGSDAWAADRQRPCEETCAIFVNAPALAQIAQDLAGDPLASFERAIEEGVCQSCTLSTSAGDYCAERLTRDCPLSCYAADVLATLEPIVVRRSRNARRAASRAAAATPFRGRSPARKLA